MSSRRSRTRSRSRSPDRQKDLPHDAEPISESDYFLKSVEFRVWLKDERGKYFDQLSGEKARSYFRKFVKAWNKGKLQPSLYKGVEPTTQINTAYKWSFAESASKSDRLAVQAARNEVAATTYGASSSSRPATSSRTIGPTLPTSSDLTLSREAQASLGAADERARRKRARTEADERVEEAVGPRPVGREGALEAKRARRENDRSFRERGDDGFVEADEKTLLGGGDSFQDHLARRDAARRRNEDKKGTGKIDRLADTRERTTVIREKEKATMDMFMKMAAERFG